MSEQQDKQAATKAVELIALAIEAGLRVVVVLDFGGGAYSSLGNVPDPMVFIAQCFNGDMRYTAFARDENPS